MNKSVTSDHENGAADSAREHCNGDCNGSAVNGSAANGSKPLHRISEVRQRQGMSLRSVSRQMKIDVRRLRSEESASSDLLLSALYKWQKVLDVPISELLVDSDDPLSPMVMKRAQLVKMMKTVAALLEKTEASPIRRLVETLRGQLLELMPELSEVSAWHSVGQRRTSEELGRIFETRLPDDFFTG